jgi:hypothetical protein
MDMKNFFNYLKYKSFDDAVHHARRISMERTAESEFLFNVIQQKEKGWRSKRPISLCRGVLHTPRQP